MIFTTSKPTIPNLTGLSAAERHEVAGDYYEMMGELEEDLAAARDEDERLGHAA